MLPKSILRIRVSEKHDGFVFSIDPRDLGILRSTGTHLAKKIFISYETKSDFSYIHGNDRLFDQVIQLLIGLSPSKVSKFIKKVQFIRAINNQIISVVDL